MYEKKECKISASHTSLEKNHKTAIFSNKKAPPFEIFTPKERKTNFLTITGNKVNLQIY